MALAGTISLRVQLCWMNRVTRGCALAAYRNMRTSRNRV